MGYDLTTALAVSAADGTPLAPLRMHLKTADTLLRTSPDPPGPRTHHLEQVLPLMQETPGWGLGAPGVHGIDREADSVGHYRQWDRKGHQFLVRADDRQVLWNRQPLLLSAVVRRLETLGAFSDTREVEYKGKKVRQGVAETPVTLHRPAKHRAGGRRHKIPGRPLELRLVVAQVRSAAGKVLATRRLLTNVPTAVADAGTIALWYYWRWRIESFFTLLKSGGQQVEFWEQESGAAMARRLLVAAMACGVIWGLERQEGPEAQEIKTLLVRLSGRQMQRHRPHTASAMLAGLFVLLPILDLLERHGGDLQALQQLAYRVLPFLAPRVDV